MLVIQVSLKICISVTDEKFPLFMNVAQFQAQGTKDLENMANGGGGTKLFPQESPLGGLWSRAAQLVETVLDWEQWTQELAAFRVLYICALYLVCPTELSAGKGCLSSSRKYLRKEWMNDGTIIWLFLGEQ